MNAEAAIELFKSLVLFTLYVMLPFLGVILVIGLLTSLMQSITSIQEQTLTFVPKLVAFSLAILALSPWLLRSMTEFTIRTFTRMGGMGG